ncbi:MAG: four helix bundle protein [Candidatus Omnitrophica bacterium]|nr:four helix bundle protein [Candidatus Omnitrophota bacterium]
MQLVEEKTGYRKLKVWQKADELAVEVYKITQKLPGCEFYGIVLQIRRAALSVPTNIAEGSGRQNRNEIRQFLNIALGSLSEVEYLLEFCRKIGYLSRFEYERIEGIRSEVGGLLWRFYCAFQE